ncbi:MAG: hypothetical protein AB7G06_00445 [Bdellovibrionales bacterium]
MTDSLRIAVTGLVAASKKVQAAASNIANAQSGNYQSIEAQNSAQVSGNSPSGVLTDFKPAGLPEVNLEANLVSLLQASAAYKANAAVIAKEDERTDYLLKALDTNT